MINTEERKRDNNNTWKKERKLRKYIWEVRVILLENTFPLLLQGREVTEAYTCQINP
jgi:hypothetical protein